MTAQQKVAAGAVCVILGAWLLHEGYEGSGRRRPFLVRFLPGP